MAFWDGLSNGARAAVGAGAAAVVAAVGYFGVMRPAVVSPEPAAVVAAPEVAKPAEVVAVKPAEVALSEVIAPSFDVVRVAPDGAATVAGAAAAGAVVSLQVDGVEVATATADGQGKFAALFDLAPSPVARMLSLVATGPDGAQVLGAQTVAIAPIVVPEVAVAQADAVAQAPAVQAPAALLVAPEGVKVLQPAAEVPAEVAANVSVETITYAADGAVVLGGHGQAAGALRVYLDGRAVAEAAVGADGAWGVTLADVAAGIYTLRVDQLAADGKVTSRFETPFIRETLQALAAVAPPVVAAVAAVEPAVTAAASAPAASAPVAPEPALAATVAAVEPAPKPVVVAQTTPAKPAPVSITVQPGYTLWGIAQQSFGEGVMYVQVFEANKDKIKNPDLIYPGQVFTIPTAP